MYERSRSANPSHDAEKTLWIAAVSTGVLFMIQAALADSEAVTLRYVLSVLVTGGAALVARRVAGAGRAGQPPDPTSLTLGGLASLSIWPVAWWLMDLTNTLLEDGVGRLPLPQPVIVLSDSLLGLDLQPAVYEIGIVFAVVLIPLAQAWLWWGLVLPRLETLLGTRRGVWVSGLWAGGMWALTSPQGITPALPWGLSSLGGYLLVGCLAAWSAALARSAWAGFAVQFAFAYASLAWTDDLFRELGRRGHGDPAWLTIVLLGVFVAVVLLQVIRYREAGAPPPASQRRQRLARALGVPVLITIAAILVMAALDMDARQGESAGASQTPQQGNEQSQQP